MRQFVWKNRLLVLIFIYIISLTGCGEVTVPVVDLPKQPAEGKFDAEYYILKKAAPDDYEKVEEFSRSADVHVAVEAATVLGYYEFRRGNTEEALRYFITNYARAGVTDYIKSMNELWRLDIALEEQDYIGASVWSKRIGRKADEPETVRAVYTYCRLHNIEAADSDPYEVCVLNRLSGTSEPYVEELIDTQLNILVTSSKNETGGVLYYYTKNFDSLQSKDFKIRMGRVYREGDWDFILDLDNGHLAGRGYGIFFKPDLSYPLEHMNQYVELDKCGKILLGVSSDLEPSAIELKTLLEDRENGPEVEIININKLYVTGIRKLLSLWEEESFCAVAAGNESEINNFIPTVKQYILNPDKQRIFVLKTVDTGGYYSGDYMAYYTDMYIFPSINLTMGDDMREFASEYILNTGKEPTYEVLIGYDMMHFINRLSVHGVNTAAFYLTDIVGIKDDKVSRSVRGFYIDKSGKITEIDVIQPLDVILADDNGGTAVGESVEYEEEPLNSEVIELDEYDIQFE